MTLSNEQIAQRLQGIGSSDVAAICGVSPYASAHDVWCTKLELAHFAGNEATELGQYFEPAIARMFADRTGQMIEKAHDTVVGAESWMLATPDYYVTGYWKQVLGGWTTIPYVLPILVECKHVGMRTMHHWGSGQDDVPYYYLTQVQWQMHVTGLRRVDVAVVLGGIEFRHYTIEYDAQLCAMLEQTCRKFWFEHVLTKVPPQVDGSEGALRMLNALYPRSETKFVPAPADAAPMFERLAAIEEEEGNIETRKRHAQNEIKNVMGDAEAMTGHGYAVKWKTSKDGKRPFKFERAKSKKEAA